MPNSCNPKDCSLPGFCLGKGIFQARILEWVAISFSSLGGPCLPACQFPRPFGLLSIQQTFTDPGNSVVIPQLWTSHLHCPVWHPVEGTLGLGSSCVPSPRAAALPGAHKDALRASRPLSSCVDSGKQGTSLSLSVLICKWR